MKVLTMLLVLFFISSLMGCQAAKMSEGIGEQSAQTSENRNTQHAAPGTYVPFSIEKVDKEYIYRIYDDNVLADEGTSAREPICHYITDSLIYVSAQTGTGQSTNWGFFYDYVANRRSETFHWVLNYTESIVALGDPDKVIIRSIFDDTYYLEITAFEKAVAKVADGILSADFSKDMTTVTITYVVEDTYEKATQTFSLT